MITVHEVEQGSPEWHALRAGLYTGSNAHKVLKFGAIEYSLTEGASFGGNFFTKRGHILEDEALELYEAITGHKVKRIGFVTNSKYPICGYSPDGLDEDMDLPLEVKAFNEIKHMKMYKGEIPMEILAQMHFGQLVWEKKGGRLIVYNPDLEAEFALKIIEVRYNRNIQSNFKRILSKEVAHAR